VSHAHSEHWLAGPDVAPAEAYVLVVDDDSVNRLLLSRSLEREGHRSATAEDGRRALEILRAESFDVVLLDVVMPEIDGFCATSRSS
jgi:CheY-like chemotaxis protein